MARTGIEKELAKITGAAVTELPVVTASDVGKVLQVDAEGKWVAASLVDELPAVTASDVGKLLAVNAEGEWAAVAPSEE